MIESQNSVLGTKTYKQTSKVKHSLEVYSLALAAVNEDLAKK